jgi:Domain of unknown function (DUF4349)
MPDLETLLRDVRPAPDPAWTALLDPRVAARFSGVPHVSPRWKAPLIALRDHFLAFGVAGAVASMLLVLVIAAGNSRTGEDSAKSSGGSASNSDSGSSSSGSAKSPPPAPLAAAPETAARVQRKDAALTLSCTPAQVATVTDRAIRVVDNLDGFVQSSEINSQGSDAGASLSMKVPSARLETALGQLSRLAHVKARSQQSEDLTDQKAALEAAVRDARADVAGLRARLAKAATDKERSRLRAELDTASRRVTRRERDVASLNRQVAYATIDLSIEGDRRGSGAAPVAPGDHWTPGDALHDAGRVLEVIAGVLVIALAILLPLAAIAVVIALAARIFTRRARERALELA